MRLESKCNTKENHQNTREQKKKRNQDELEKSQKTINKMVKIHLSIITLNANALNSPFKRHRVAK